MLLCNSRYQVLLGATTTRLVYCGIDQLEAVVRLPVLTVPGSTT